MKGHHEGTVVPAGWGQLNHCRLTVLLTPDSEYQAAGLFPESRVDTPCPSFYMECQVGAETS